jgi:uncharacterized repeat protein (TIGR03847 family)
MPGIEIELNPVDFITVGTVGPKGRRVFYLQAGNDEQVVSLTIEKEQSWALSEAITELMTDIEERFGSDSSSDDQGINMDLREPIEPLFRVAQMGLGYDEDEGKIIVVAQALVITENEDDIEMDEDEALSLQAELSDVVRIWCDVAQIQALSKQAMRKVEEGRPDAKQNGRLIYYWT